MGNGLAGSPGGLVGVGVGAGQLSGSPPLRADVSWVPGGGPVCTGPDGGCRASWAEEFLGVPV